MFIISKRNLMIQRPGANPYIIRKDYVGEIPEDIASHWLVKAAINDGTIATPQKKRSKQTSVRTQKMIGSRLTRKKRKMENIAPKSSREVTAYVANRVS